MLRKIDPELWEQFKVRVTEDGRGMKAIMVRLMELYSAVGLETLERAATREGVS